MRTTWRAGDFLRDCDRCGFTFYASQTKKTWDGLWVCDADWEPRHSQDFVRGRTDQQAVPEPRPPGTDRIVGPLTTVTTAAAVAGATTLNVETSARMVAADNIGIILANGETHRAIIDTVVSSIQITMTAGTKLPGSVASGALIVDYDAVSAPNIG